MIRGFTVIFCYPTKLELHWIDDTKRNTMTRQASDIFHYGNFKYYSLSYDGEGLIRPYDFGMEPGYVSTGCYAGFISTYEITKDGLFLTKMKIANTLDKYSTIQGIRPKPIGKNNSYLVYQRLRLFSPIHWNYTAR